MMVQLLDGLGMSVGQQGWPALQDLQVRAVACYIANERRGGKSDAEIMSVLTGTTNVNWVCKLAGYWFDTKSPGCSPALIEQAFALVNNAKWYEGAAYPGLQRSEIENVKQEIQKFLNSGVPIATILNKLRGNDPTVLTIEPRIAEAFRQITLGYGAGMWLERMYDADGATTNYIPPATRPGEGPLTPFGKKTTTDNTIWWVVGGVAVLAVGFYMYRRYRRG